MNSTSLDRKIEHFINHSTGMFTIAQLIADLNCKFSSEEEAASFHAKLERELDGNNELFKARHHDGYLQKKLFFQDGEFCIAPDQYELEHGLLFTGHRFATFCPEQIFPSEIAFIEAGGGKAKTKDVNEPLERLSQYYLLLGNEQIFDTLVAENQANLKALQGNGTAKLSVKAFNLKDFYRRNNFEPGDAVAVKIMDWSKGVFEFSHLPGNRRKAAGVKKWIEKFSAALLKTIDEYENYLEIPEQLSLAFFTGGRELLTAAGASLDEFYRNNQLVEIVVDNGQAVLARKSDDEFATDFMAIPEGIMISEGKTSSVDEILNEIGIPLQATEIDSYMLDQCYHGELEFVDFFSRCFGAGRLNFVDDAQESIFLNYLEDRWESIAENYNPSADEFKGQIRERALEVIEDRLEWLQFLDSVDVAAAQLPEPAMQKLAENSLRLTMLLQMLNSKEYGVLPDEIENLLDTIEELAAVQAELITQMSSFMNVGKIVTT